jgi:leukotriene-A4 hydrolase
VFDQFLREWFASHAFGTVATADFLTSVHADLISKHPVLAGQKAPSISEWITGVGLPEGAPEPAAEVLDTVEANAKAFAAGELEATQLPTATWTPWHWLHFLRSLPTNLKAEQMATLDAAFALTESGNAEILGEWLELAARHRYEPAYPRLESFLIEVGRRKFLTPIYRALLSSDDGRAQAKQIYAKARAGYHSISRGTLDGLLL